MKKLSIIIVFGFESLNLLAQTWDTKFQEYQNNIESQNYTAALNISNDLTQIALNEKDSSLIYKSLLLKINLEIAIDTVPLNIVEADLNHAFNYSTKGSNSQCFELYSLKARLCYYNQNYAESINNQIISIDCFAKEWGINNPGYFTMLYNLFYGHNLNQSSRNIDFYADQMCNIFIYSDLVDIPDSKFDLALKLGAYYTSLGQYEKAKRLYTFASEFQIEDRQIFVAKYQLAEALIHLECYKEAYNQISQLKKNSKSLSNEQFSAVLNLKGLLDYYQGNYTSSIHNFQESIKLIEDDTAGLATTYFNLAQSYLYAYWENSENSNFLEMVKLNLDKSIQNSKDQSINDKVYYLPLQIQIALIIHDFHSQKLKNELNNLIKSGEVSDYHLAHLHKAKADIFRFENNFDSSSVNLKKALIYYQNIGNKESIEYLSTFNNYLKDCFLDQGTIKFENIIESNRIIKQLTQSNLVFLSRDERVNYVKRLNLQINELNDLGISIKNDKFSEISMELLFLSKSLLLETSRELDQAIAQSSDEDMKAQFAEMKQLRKLYSKMQSEGSTNREVMDRYKVEADSLDKILVNKIGEYEASNRKFEITWKDVQSNLSTSDAAIEFARYYDDKDSLYKYMALVVRPDYEYPKLVKLGEEEQIRVAVSTKDFTALYGLAWQGIDSLLTGVKTVYYSPAGELNNVAFSAMCSNASDGQLAVNNNQSNRGVVIQSEKGATQSCNSVLMDRYALHQLTTTRYLADGTLKKDQTLQPTLTLLGGINFDDVPEYKQAEDKEQSNEDFALQTNLDLMVSRSGSSFGREMPFLEGTKEEVTNIAGLMTNSNWYVQTKSDKAAGEYEFKKELETTAPGVLHIATHGFAFPDEVKKESKLMDMNQTSTFKVSEDPMVRCGLMLGGSNISWTGNPQKMIEQTGDDGILTAAEVANLDLSNTKLVVLSACETGLGKIEGSEGTFGLKRGFKLAGVEQMIVSLWSVPDKETMELMTLFYSDLTKTLNPVTSFENAQKEIRTKYPTDPEKWAGFVLVR